MSCTIFWIARRNLMNRRNLMSNKRKMILGISLLAAAMLSGCGFGPDDPEDQVVVVESPTPEPTKAVTPTPTPTITPVNPDSTYTSADKSVSIKLPDATWAVKADEGGVLTFESPDQGRILITHRTGDDVNNAVVPNSEDMAKTLEISAGLTEGTDFELQNYTNTDVSGTDLISYLVSYKNPEKAKGAAFRLYKVLFNKAECYSLELTGKTIDNDLPAKLAASMDSFKILSEDSLVKEAANLPVPVKTEEPAGEEPADNGSFSTDALSDTDQTRTIYTNDGTGRPIVITPDGEGSWYDDDGNVFHFAENGEDVYDQNGVDYYYHGEPGRVAYMSTQEE